LAYFGVKSQKMTFSNKIEISTPLLVFYNHFKKTQMFSTEQNQTPPNAPSKLGTDGVNEARIRFNTATKNPIPFSLND